MHDTRRRIAARSKERPVTAVPQPHPSKCAYCGDPLTIADPGVSCAQCRLSRAYASEQDAAPYAEVIA